MKPTLLAALSALLLTFSADAKTGAFRGNIYAIACIGDSITQGTGLGVATVVNAWPSKLGQLLSDGRHIVLNAGVGGTTSTLFKQRWDYGISQGGDWSAVVVFGGVNDVKNDVAASTVFANLQAIYDSAHSKGAVVVAVTIMPWKNATVATWTTGRQTLTESVNTSIRNYVSANSSNTYLVDAYVLMGDGLDSQLLSATYDSGDHLHPNQTGQDFIASQVKAALGL